MEEMQNIILMKLQNNLKSYDKIVENYICKRFEVTKAALIGRSRISELVKIRILLFRWLKAKKNMTYSEIGRRYNRNHATILRHCKFNPFDSSFNKLYAIETKRFIIFLKKRKMKIEELQKKISAKNDEKIAEKNNIDKEIAKLNKIRLMIAKYVYNNKQGREGHILIKEIESLIMPKIPDYEDPRKFYYKKFIEPHKKIQKNKNYGKM